MRSAITSILLSFFVVSMVGQNTTTLVQLVDNDDLVDGNTYRVFLVLEEGQSLHAVFGDELDPLLIQAEEGLFQHELGGDDGTSMNQAILSIYPDLAFDSYVTIGSPIPSNEAWHAGIDWDVWNNEANIDTDNGAWFVLPDAEFSSPDAQLKILIGQFTSVGAVSGTLNAQ
ncbi:MAG: hypothetical protein AAF193_09860, partial [Bacteroidota bacterium]